MSEEILSQLPNLDIPELWNLTIMFEEDCDEFENVKYGYSIKFDIRQYIRYLSGDKNNIKINSKSEHVIIGNKKYKLTDFDDELDKRKATMRNLLYEEFKFHDILEPRSGISKGAS